MMRFFRAFVLIASLPVLAGSAAAQALSWSVLGPLPASRSLSSVGKDHALERGFSRLAGKLGADALHARLHSAAGRNAPQWKVADEAVAADGGWSVVSGDGGQARGEPAVVFLHATLGKSRSLVLELAHDDAVRVWVDDEVVHTRKEDALFGATSALHVIDLPSSDKARDVLIKFQTDGGDWRVRVRPSPRPPQVEIDAAIDRGLDYLKRAQWFDGSWGYRRSLNDEPGHVGFTLYTMLRCGLDREDPSARLALQFLEQDHSDINYSLASMVLALAEYGDRYRDRIEDIVEEIHGLIGSNGLVRYSLKGKNNHMAPDLSNSKFTALAFRAAESVGVKIPKDWWLAIAEGALAACERNRASAASTGKRAAPRGFGYTAGGPAYGSMTVAGLGALVIARDALGKKLPRKLRKDVDLGLRSGLAWLDEHFVIDQNPKRDKSAPQHLYFWLWGLERLGSLDERGVLGNADWYGLGAKWLLENQRDDGSWADSPSVSTHLALLFLKRATASGPVTGLPKDLNDQAGDFVTEDADAEVALRAHADTALTIWVERLSEDVRAKLGGRGAGGGGSLRLAKMEWFAEGPGIEDPAVPFLRSEFAPESPPALHALTAKLDPGHNGQWSLRVVLTGFADDDAEAARYESPALAVTIEDVFDEVRFGYVEESARNRMPDTATASVSSTSGGNLPPRVFDRDPTTDWVCGSKDKEPWIEIDFGRAMVVSKIVLMPNSPSPTVANKPRPVAGEITLISSGTPETLPFRMESDLLRRTVVDLGSERKLRRIKLRVTESTYPLGEGSVGFSEVEIHRDR